MSPATAAPITTTSPNRAYWLPTLAAWIMIAITFALGQWQLGRASLKSERESSAQSRAQLDPVALPAAPIAAPDLDLRPVTVRGTFAPAHTIYLDNRVHNRQPGYHVLTMLRIAAPGAPIFVLVNRGWVPQGVDRAMLPPVPTPEGEVTLEGVARAYPSAVYELKADTPTSKVWQNITLQRVAAATGLIVQPVLVEQHSATADGLIRAWPTPSGPASHGMTADKHRGYAFQWFALSALLLGLWLYFGLRQMRQMHHLRQAPNAPDSTTPSIT